MPRVKIDYIVSFSSEDPDNPASNLLCWEVSKKRWLCAKGETSCSVVLQLTKAVKISTLNIGTYNTAFVEVLVGRSEKPNEPFQVLLPSSVFLSLAESRRTDDVSGAERVRSFSTQALQPAANQRWDRLRVVCSQPFNKHCKFGLSFIQISEPEGSESSGTPSAPLPTSVRHTLAHSAPDSWPDSDPDDDFRPGELFAKHTSSSEDAGSQIRHASSQALKNIADPATKLVKTPISKQKNTPSSSASGDYGTNRQRDDLLYTDDDNKPHAKIDHVVQRHKDDKDKNESSNKKKRKETPDKEPSTKKAKHDDTNKNIDTSFKDKKDTTPHSKRKKDSEDESSITKKARKEKHDSSNLSRNSASDSFRKESNSNRSHNDRSRNGPSTSKKGEQNKASSSTGRTEATKKSKNKSERDLSTVLSGVVLSLSGYVNPERSALRQLALDMGAQVRRDWTPDCNLLICAFPNTPKLKQVRSADGRGSPTPIVTADFLKQAYSKKRKPNWKVFAVESKYKEDPSPDDESDGQTDHETDVEQEEECDTDDEIEKAMNSTRKSPSPSPSPARAPAPQSDEDDTDRETGSDVEAVERIDPARSLPALFDGRTFLLSAGGDVAVAAEWERYVRAYGGVVLQESELDPDSVVDYVISPDGSSSHAAAACVRPTWLWQCHHKKRLLPIS